MFFWHRVSFWDLKMAKRSDPNSDASLLFFRSWGFSLSSRPLRWRFLLQNHDKALRKKRRSSLRVRMKVVPQSVPYVSRSWTFWSFELENWMFVFCLLLPKCYQLFLRFHRCFEMWMQLLEQKGDIKFMMYYSTPAKMRVTAVPRKQCWQAQNMFFPLKRVYRIDVGER